MPGLLALSAGAAVAGLASGRPELVVLAVPLLLFLGVGLSLCETPQLRGTVKLDRARVIEGDHVVATVVLHNDAATDVELELAPLATAHLALAPAAPVTLRLAAGASAELRYEAHPRRWGAHAVGPLVVRARDRLGLASWDMSLAEPAVLRAFPREQVLRALVAPRRTRPFLGAHVARMRGVGIEFADVRPYVVGDRVGHVNWRVTARRGALHTTERHPEHSTDVVLLLDTFAEARDATGGTLDAAVRATASLARAHLARRDRVALVDFGGTLQWLQPAFGTVQLYRIIDALLMSEIAFSYAWREVDSIPRKVLPHGALIIAVSPLLDERSIRLITSLRNRGSDVTVLEVSPLQQVSPGAGEADAVAFRLWHLQRLALRRRLQSLGIGVAVWDDHGLLAASIEEVSSFRRSARQPVRG